MKVLNCNIEKHLSLHTRGNIYLYHFIVVRTIYNFHTTPTHHSNRFDGKRDGIHYTLTNLNLSVLEIMQGAEFQQGLFLSLTELVGDYGAKIGNPVLTLVAYNFLGLELLQFLQKGSLTLVNDNWDAISNVFTFLLGYYMGERFSRQQYIGLFLITVGLFLIQ